MSHAVLRALLPLVLALTACQSDPDPRDAEGRRVFRIGYMLNVTHAPALVALEAGLYSEALGEDVVVRPVSFLAGPAVIEALFAGEIDVAYVGPNPAVNAFQRSEGEALQIVAGSTAGGASLIVQPWVEGPRDLAGTRLASPAIANTQDVALRTYLRGHGVEASVLPMAPTEILHLFREGQLAGAFVAEPWASRLVLEGGGRVLLRAGPTDPTTVVVVARGALEERPELVDRFLGAHAAAVRLLQESRAIGRRLAGAHLAEALGRPLAPAVLERAFEEMSFTMDVDAAGLEARAREAHALGFLPRPGTGGLLACPELPCSWR